MKISKAKSHVTRQRIFAVFFMIITIIVLVCTALKSVYSSAQVDMTAIPALSHSIQSLVSFIYEKTQFVSLIWKWSPVIRPQELNTTGNWGFLFVFICTGIARLILDSASNLSLRIKKATREVEELGWKEELSEQNGYISNVKPDVLQINIELDQKDQWYKRPIGIILLGIAIVILGQWLNLQFRLINP